MKIGICDDNIQERDYYISRLTTLSAQINVPITFAAYDNGNQMLFEIAAPEDQPEIIYLDINMPDISGVDVAKTLRDRNYRGEIVFLTKSENYWLPAFDVHAYHYIVKGDCSEKKFNNIFFSVVKAVLAKNEDHMVFTCCGETATVPVKDIRYFEVINRVITVYYSKKQFDFYSTLFKVEEQLYNHGFLRVHKSYLVPLSFIRDVTYTVVTLKDSTKIPVGRAYQKNIKSFLNERSVKREEK